MSETWIDADGWVRRIDDDGNAWRHDPLAGWVRTPDYDTEATR